MSLQILTKARLDTCSANTPSGQASRTALVKVRRLGDHFRQPPGEIFERVPGQGDGGANAGFRFAAPVFPAPGVQGEAPDGLGRRQQRRLRPANG